MSDKKQSSIEWLESKVNAMIQNGGDTDLLAVIEHIQQAKAMHNKEIVDAHVNGNKEYTIGGGYELIAEHYYNEHYGK